MKQTNMNSALRRFYTNTVKPVTAISLIVSMYSGGYSSGVDDWIYGKKIAFIPFIMVIAQSAVVGSCIGITYPVSINVLLEIDYTMYLKEREKEKGQN